jgi:hypothetical protein
MEQKVPSMKSHKAERVAKIRPIEPGDNAVVAEIIRLVMAEFKAVGCGYSSNGLLQQRC